LLIVSQLLLATSSSIFEIFSEPYAEQPVSSTDIYSFVGDEDRMGPIKSFPRKSSGRYAASRQRASNPINARKPPKKEKVMKLIFKGMTMSIAGTHFKFDMPLSHEKIAQYITLHGGTYEKEVTDATTHLICSINEYKRAGVQGNDLPRILYNVI
jgi:hypothetical protein